MEKALGFYFESTLGFLEWQRIMALRALQTSDFYEV